MISWSFVAQRLVRRTRIDAQPCCTVEDEREQGWRQAVLVATSNKSGVVLDDVRKLMIEDSMASLANQTVRCKMKLANAPIFRERRGRTLSILHGLGRRQRSTAKQR